MTSASNPLRRTSRTILRLVFGLFSALVALVVAGGIVLLLRCLGVNDLVTEMIRQGGWRLALITPVLLVLLLAPFYAADRFFWFCLFLFDTRIFPEKPRHEQQT